MAPTPRATYAQQRAAVAGLPKATFNPVNWTAGKLRVWAPSLALYGAAAGIAGVYFSDVWLGRYALQYVPWVGDKWKQQQEE
eukprot:m.481498 g.481498  ORF g.481498 m.481498 type:complete len:82 (-) comp22189_c0_seq1:133-378(-)